MKYIREISVGTIICFFIIACSFIFSKDYIKKSSDYNNHILLQNRFDSLSRCYKNINDSLFLYHLKDSSDVFTCGNIVNLLKDQIENYAIENRSLLRQLKNCSSNNQNYHVITLYHNEQE